NAPAPHRVRLQRVEAHTRCVSFFGDFLCRYSPVPVSGLGGFDQNSAILAESFAPYVSDALFVGNRIVKVLWDNAQRHDEGRFLALPILTSLNDTAEVFGQYDTLATGPQSLYSVASMPWSWYQTAVSLDYITVK